MSVMYTPNKHPKLDNITDIYLWHCRLNHINKNRINRVAQESILNINDCKSLPTCESYFLRTFTKKGERASKVLGLIHSDICDL